LHILIDADRFASELQQLELPLKLTVVELFEENVLFEESLSLSHDLPPSDWGM